MVTEYRVKVVEYKMIYVDYTLFCYQVNKLRKHTKMVNICLQIEE